MEFERDYDILVAGAGVAGIAAALEAARAGMRAALVEKTILLGGLATSGLIDVYLPLCDGHGTQVTFGIAEELLHASIRYGPGDVPSGWTDGAATKAGRYFARFSPAAFALALDEMVVEAGIELWLDTLVCTPAMDGDRVVGLEVETKGGRGLLRAHCVIDTTGDADVAFRAGVPCAEGSNWLSIWAGQAHLERAQQAVADGSGAPLYDPPRGRQHGPRRRWPARLARHRRPGRHPVRHREPPPPARPLQGPPRRSGRGRAPQPVPPHAPLDGPVSHHPPHRRPDHDDRRAARSACA